MTHHDTLISLLRAGSLIAESGASAPHIRGRSGVWNAAIFISSEANDWPQAQVRKRSRTPSFARVDRQPPIAKPLIAKPSVAKAHIARSLSSGHLSPSYVRPWRISPSFLSSRHVKLHERRAVSRRGDASDHARRRARQEVVGGAYNGLVRIASQRKACRYRQTSRADNRRRADDARPGNKPAGIAAG